MGFDELGFSAAVNNRGVLDNNLLQSSTFVSGGALLDIREGYASASSAYNAFLDATDKPVAVFAHQDIYFPPGWCDALLAFLKMLERDDPNWAIVGSFGITASGAQAGHVFSSGLQKEIHFDCEAKTTISSFDEIVLVVNRRVQIRFDEDLPGFHLYGADIGLTAAQNKLACYLLNSPVVHNSVPVLSLSGAYSDAYRYLQKKWANVLPVRTTVTTISRSGWPLLKTKFRLLRRNRRRLPDRDSAPTSSRDISRKLGWE